MDMADVRFASGAPRNGPIWCKRALFVDAKSLKWDCLWFRIDTNV